jgi:carbon storage regulator
MLVLSRKHGQSITIGDQIVITVVRVGRGNVQIGVAAPDDVKILRQELADRERDAAAINSSHLLAGVAAGY